MPRLIPVHYKKLVKIFESIGFTFDRQEGDHLIYVKVGVKRPLVIPMYSEVPVFIIKNNLKSADVSREDYFRFLRKF